MLVLFHTCWKRSGYGSFWSKQLVPIAPYYNTQRIHHQLIADAFGQELWTDWLVFWCLSSPTDPHWSTTWIGTSTPLSVYGTQCLRTNIQKGNPTHGIQCSPSGFALLQCCKIVWTSQTNLWPPLSHQTLQMQKYLLPIIHDFMQWISRYNYFTKLSLVVLPS